MWGGIGLSPKLASCSFFGAPREELRAQWLKHALLRMQESMTEDTILVVDDDEVTRHTLRRWLTHLQLHGQVLEAADGQQALALVEAHCQATVPPRPLLVLLDLNMPVMDGFEFLECQQQLPITYQHAMTVVVVSAAHETTARARAQALAVEVKTKPLDITQLAELVHHYLPRALPT